MKRRCMISIIVVLALLLNMDNVVLACDTGNGNVKEIRVCAVGDNLIHSRVYESGIKEDGSRDYSDMYRYYADYLTDYDICVVNQETVFVEDSNDFSGYPTFGGPTEIGTALIDAGFNTVTTATNHVMDKGIDGLLYSHRFWTNWGIDPVGTYTYSKRMDIDNGRDTANHAVFMTKDDIKVGMLNYTYGTNGIPIPEEYSYAVGILYNKEAIKKEIKWAKNKCDILIVFPHWGIEYQYKPCAEQKEWAQLFADNGADIIIGTHPHVIQPLEYIMTSSGKQVPCYYSLGNFISNQNEVPRMLGAAATFTIKKDASGAWLEDVKAAPTVTHISRYSESFYARSLFDYTTEEEVRHRMRRVKGNEFSIDKLWELWYSVFTNEQTSVL